MKKIIILGALILSLSLLCCGGDGISGPTATLIVKNEHTQTIKEIWVDEFSDTIGHALVSHLHQFRGLNIKSGETKNFAIKAPGNVNSYLRVEAYDFAHEYKYIQNPGEGFENKTIYFTVKNSGIELTFDP